MSLTSVALGLLALVSTLGTPPEAGPKVDPRPLLTAIEVLCERKFTESCDVVIALTLSTQGLPDGERIRLHFLAAMRAIDAGNDAAANLAIAEALKVDPLAMPPPYASPRLLELLEKARPESPPLGLVGGGGGGGPAISQDAVIRILLQIVEKLYLNVHNEGAMIVLEVARSSMTLSRSERVQVELWWGVLKVELGDELGARVAFREALLLDRTAELPSQRSAEAQRVLNEVKLAFPPPAPSPAQVNVAPTTSVSVSVAPPVTPPATNIFLVEGPRRTGLYVGGAGLALIAGGVAAGSVALVAHQDLRRASTNGDWAAYARSRETGKIANNIADGLFGLGVAVLGVGAFVLWREPSGVRIEASAGQGQASVVAGGHF